MIRRAELEEEERRRPEDARLERPERELFSLLRLPCAAARLVKREPRTLVNPLYNKK